MKIFDPVHNQRIGSWLHGFGRVAAKEEQLLSPETTRRLFELTDKESLFQLIGEAGYRGHDLKAAMDEGREEDLAFLYRVSPDKNFVELLLLPYEVHNLKAAVKRSLARGERIDAAELESYLMSPAIYSPEALLSGLEASALELPGKDMGYSKQTGESLGEFTKWMADAVAEAEAVYKKHYDLAAVDTVFEQVKWRLMLDRAEKLDSPFILDYVRHAIDMRNLDLTLRVKRLNRPASVLEDSFLPGGHLKREVFLDFYPLKTDALKQALRQHGLAEFTRVLPPEEESFSKAEDEAKLRLLADAAHMMAGPERLLSWFERREFERRNIQLALMAIETKQPQENRVRHMRTVL